MSTINSKDSSASGSSYSYDTYNPKFNNDPEEYFDNYRLSDWDTDYTHRQRGTIGSDMYSSGSSHRPKKLSSPPTSNSKRAVTKIKPKPKPKNGKRLSQQSRELDRDLVPPPPKKL